MIGIYKITNNINQKSYIGQSVNIKARWKKHREHRNTISEPYCNYPLYRSFKKYGIENFDFSVVEQCSKSMLNEREVYWINYYDTYKNGYNQTLGGDSQSYCKLTDEIKESIYFDLKNSNLTMKQIADKHNISHVYVYYINIGHSLYNDNVDYPIRKKQIRNKVKPQIQPKKETKCVNTCIICGKQIKRNSTYCKHCFNVYRKSKIPSKEELTSLILKYPITKVGLFYGVSDKCVVKWLQKYELPFRKKDIESYKIEC